jgi:ERF superfamily protein
VPPRKRAETPPADEAQADTPPAVTVEEMTPSDSAEAEARWADQTAERELLSAASMAGLLGDVKEIREHLNAMQSRLGARWEWALPTDGPTLTDEINALARRIEDLAGRVSDVEHGAVRASAPAQPAILAAVWSVMNDVQGVGKHGQMEYGERYRYRKYDDLKRELGAACRTHGIMLQSQVMSVTNQHPFEKDPRKARVQVHMRYKFTSLTDGSTLVFEAVGESIDTSDKATGKAQTMALKTALDQAFMLAMEDIEDPDATRPGEDDVPREARQERRDAVQARREPQRPEPDHQVGDQVTVGGTAFTKHSEPPGFPNDRPRNAGDPWDGGPPPDNRTPEAKAQAAADRASQATTKDAWSRISDAARGMGLYDVVVNVNGAQMALKHHLVAVARTLT